MEIISRRTRHEVTHHELSFWYADHPGSWGFSFECDENGNVDPRHDTPEGNYRKCLTGSVDGHAVLPVERHTWKHTYTTPAVGKCEVCGRHVTLDGFTNTCDCGADYNMSGQLLASRSQWGEETGESLSDILRIR